MACDNAVSRLVRDIQQDIQNLTRDYTNQFRGTSLGTYFKNLANNLFDMGASLLMDMASRLFGGLIDEINNMIAEVLSAVMSYVTSAIFHVFSILGNTLTPGALYVLMIGQILEEVDAEQELQSMINITKEIRKLLSNVISLLHYLEYDPYLHKFNTIMNLVESTVDYLKKASDSFGATPFSRLDYDQGINNLMRAKSVLRHAMSLALGVSPQIFDQFDPSSPGSLYKSSEDYIFKDADEYFKKRLKERANRVKEAYRDLKEKLSNLNAEDVLPPQMLQIGQDAKNIGDYAEDLSYRAALVLPAVVFAADVSRIFKTYFLGFYDATILKVLSRGCAVSADSARFILERSVLGAPQRVSDISAVSRMYYATSSYSFFFPMFTAYQLIKLPLMSQGIVENDRRLINTYDMERMVSGVSAFSDFVIDTILGDVVSSLIAYLGADKDKREQIYKKLNSVLRDIDNQIARMEEMLSIVTDIMNRKKYIISVWLDYFAPPGMTEQDLDNAIKTIRTVLLILSGIMFSVTLTIDLAECINTAGEGDEAEDIKSSVERQMYKTSAEMETQRHLEEPSGKREINEATDKSKEDLQNLKNYAGG